MSYPEPLPGGRFSRSARSYGIDFKNLVKYHKIIFKYGSVEIGMLTAGPLHRISSRIVLGSNLQASYALNRKENTSKHRPVSNVDLVLLRYQIVNTPPLLLLLHSLAIRQLLLAHLFAICFFSETRRTISSNRPDLKSASTSGCKSSQLLPRTSNHSNVSMMFHFCPCLSQDNP